MHHGMYQPAEWSAKHIAPRLKELLLANKGYAFQLCTCENSNWLDKEKSIVVCSMICFYVHLGFLAISSVPCLHTEEEDCTAHLKPCL